MQHCSLSCLGNRCDFWGPRWASQSQIAKIAAISVRKGLGLLYRKKRATPGRWKALTRPKGDQEPLFGSGVLHKVSFPPLFSTSPIPKDPTVLKTLWDSELLVYVIVFLLRPPDLLHREPFFERKNVCNFRENGVGRPQVYMQSLFAQSHAINFQNEGRHAMEQNQPVNETGNVWMMDFWSAT